MSRSYFQRRFFLFSFLVLCTTGISAQVIDDFSDGNFSSIPKWTGDTAQYTINSSNQLQLASTGTNVSYLSLPSTAISNAEWTIWVKLSFAPSDNNNVRIYLVSDQQDLKNALNGYFIRMGENGSFDSVDFWEQSGSTETKIIDGINGHCAKTINTLRLKATRDSIGNWALYSDTLGGTNYLPEGSTTDNKHILSNYFGIVSKYTTSNSTKFYFDDVYAGIIITDKTPPAIDSLKVISAAQLDVYFNEAVDQASSQNTNNYIANNAIGNPSSALRDALDFRLVHLTFPTTFTDNLPNTLLADHVKDLNNNIMVPANKNFTWIVPAVGVYRDIIINEILADPSPVVGLPSAEFVELFNKSNKTLNLSGWKFSDGVSTGTFGNYILSPGNFLIICNNADTSFFSPFGKMLGLSSFPSLNNPGDNLSLKNSTGVLIDSVSYSDTWYQDATKKDGGYSLELINPASTTTCQASTNWIASNHPLGGTPGNQNSVFSVVPDITAPALVSVSVEDSIHITCCFSEAISNILLNDKNNYVINNFIGNPVSVKINSSCVELTFAQAMTTQNNYTLSISHIFDCSGNALSNTTWPLIYHPIQPSDIIINEILFDPKPGGVDFVEIYNRSADVIDLKNITLCSFDTITQKLSSVYVISPVTRLLQSGEYLVLSTNASAIKNQYYTSAPNQFFDMPVIPAMNISGDIVVLADGSGKIIDRFDYKQNMHFSLLTQTKGVSLERLNAYTLTQDRNNWHSAAETVGFATPGYKNSQHREENNNEDISVSPELFSPDNDGYNDVLSVNYKFDKSGLVANIQVFDAQGRMVKALTKNALLATSGSITWDGINDNNEKALIGIYVVYIEVFDLEGTVKKYKKTCVLAGKI